MEEIKLEILGLSSSQSQTGSFALVLGEVEGNRRLPIIIGMFEAQAIAIEHEQIQPNRPMTHDLFSSFANAYDFTVERVVISDLKEGVFFARIICSNGIDTKEIDSRPSDAIAIALRFKAPIFTVEKIMTEAGIVLTDTEEFDEPTEKYSDKSAEPFAQPARKPDGYKNLTVDQLNEKLNEALEQEDYETAAKIRDELGRRN